MIKYCIISPTSKINLELSSMELRVFTKNWSWVMTTSDKHYWLWFDKREDADTFINKLDISNATSYGVDVDNNCF